MKRGLLVFLACLSFTHTFSQYNYYRMAAGGTAGVNTAFADLSKKIPAPTLGGSLDFFITPFASLGFEVQKGILSGGDREKDKHHRFFQNNYSSLSFGTKIHLGQVVDFRNSNFLHAMRHFYMGIGMGVIKNSIKDDKIVRIQPGTGWKFPGTNSSTDITFPLNTGMNFNITDRWGYTRYIFNLNYQLNITAGEGMDGYNDASFGAPWSNIPDMYGVASFSLKFCFGPQGLYY
ncbi:hypothetical protein [Desertivirga brevis]|uniref:hypothetical protein n=1 Tax=Desertivirga brevis TaxID=2810310 RepID=UPI001A96A91D|nr:hypothetical protein [Pedobacter sp. SYSU D00873]